MKKPLQLYRVEIPECRFREFVWSESPEKALKEAFKVAFERRGRGVFCYDNREFIAATPFVNYLKKMGKVSAICQLAPNPT